MSRNFNDNNPAADIAAKVAQNVKQELTKNTIEIDGVSYKIDLLNAEDGLDLWENLMKVILPSVGTGLDSMQHDPIIDGSPTTFTEAMSHLSNRLDGQTLKRVSISLLTDMEVNGSKVNWSDHFKGNYGTWRKVVKFALKENFSSFFEDGWVDGVQDLMTMVSPVIGSSSAE
jgi:hypothetical protein